MPAQLPMSGNNSAVECNLAKVEVAGSNPVSRSRILKGFEEKSSNPFWLVSGVFLGYLKIASTGSARSGGAREAWPTAAMA